MEKNPGKIWEACHGNLVCLGAEDGNFSRNLLELGHTKRQRLIILLLAQQRVWTVAKVTILFMSVEGSSKWQVTGDRKLAEPSSPFTVNLFVSIYA